MIFDIHDPGELDLVKRFLPIGGQPIRIGLTSGTFDLFHHMHLVYLQRCRRQCDLLFVGVDSDDFVRERKGPERPIVPEHQRVAIVSELKCVTAAFVLSTLREWQTILDVLRVDVAFKNQAFKPEEVIGFGKVNIVIVPDIVQHASTSEIIEEIKQRKAR